MLLNVKGSWEDLQLVITRCTVDDILKIINKLKTFFEVGSCQATVALESKKVNEAQIQN